MVKGLAKLWNRLRHDLRVKCVDVSLFDAKSGYSPMSEFLKQGIVRQRQDQIAVFPFFSMSVIQFPQRSFSLPPAVLATRPNFACSR